MDPILQLASRLDRWQPPEVPDDIPLGDMPGDRVQISPHHIRTASLLFPLIVEQAAQLGGGKIVVCLCGGSGVGKSGAAAVLGHYLRSAGVGAYTLSGDNYPRRIPMYNDAERLRTFRVGGLRGLLRAGLYSADVDKALRALWPAGTDADPAMAGEYPWLAVYQAAGRAALTEYLGTEKEQDFEELSEILAAFHGGADTLWLKRMGRREEDRWYEQVDVSNTRVLILEWTHGNSDDLHGVDIPVLLCSTPEQTRVYRRARARDGNTDSPFTTMVLEIEQKKLDSCAHKAKIILSKDAEVLSCADYRARMDQEVSQ